MRLRDWYRGSDYLRHEALLRDLPLRPALLQAAARDGDLVLDVGCLGGALAQPLCQHCRVVGIDLLPDALAAACERGLLAVAADASEPLPFADASFDLVHAGEIVEHVFDPLGLFRELVRVLRPGGLLVGTVPNVVGLGERVRVLAGRAPDALGLHPDAPAGDHIRAFTVDRVAQLAQLAGLSDRGRYRAIATGGPLPWRLLKQRRASWGDLIWFELRKAA